jgi:hypothetical protein
MQGICCDSCGAEGREEITTLYVPSCTSVTFLFIAVNMIINTTTTTTHRLLAFALMLFPTDEPHVSFAEIY